MEWHFSETTSSINGRFAICPLCAPQWTSSLRWDIDNHLIRSHHPVARLETRRRLLKSSTRENDPPYCLHITAYYSIFYYIVMPLWLPNEKRSMDIVSQNMLNRLTARKSTSRMTKWRPILRTMAPRSQQLTQGGITNRDWFSDRLSNISILVLFFNTCVWSPLFCFYAFRHSTQLLQMELEYITWMNVWMSVPNLATTDIYISCQ